LTPIVILTAVNSTSERLNLLVIDDDENVASTVSLLLSRDHEVISTTDARKGLEQALTGRFDLIFCDLLMPKLSGMEIYQQLKAAHPGLEDRMVFITGGATTPEAQVFLESVQTRLIHKPFSLRQLRERIQEIRKAFENAP